jgi:GMP synthase-like glutamine amidotransferase
MHVLVVNNGSGYIDKLTRIIPQSVVEVVRYDQLDTHKAHDYDVVILSGGHEYSVVNHEKEFSKEIQFIQQVKRPLLGICLGFELIAHTYGASLEQRGEKETGVVNIQITHPDEIFQGLSMIKVYDSHRWQVSEVHGKLVELGRSLDGVEIFKHVDKFMYGFQFHPEMFVEETNGIQLFKNFFTMVRRVSV